jgi:hypothetical protein
MPEIWRTAIVHRDRVGIILETWSIERPTKLAQEQLVTSAERFCADFEGARLAIMDDYSCPLCGCTQDRACPGGCGWVEDDERGICTACQAKELIHAR